jgi:uncharacterized protein
MARPTREEIIAILAEQRTLLEDYYVRSVAIFDSVARGEEPEDSDVNLLVEFSKPVGLFHFVTLKRAPESLIQSTWLLPNR